MTGPGWHYTAKTLAARIQAVFDRVGASDIKITNVKTKKYDSKTYELTFTANMNTKIGKLSAQHYEAPIVKVGDNWRIQWSPRLLFPSMDGKDTVQIDLIAATRGQIYDRNNQLLAKNGDVTQAGLVPGVRSRQRHPELHPAHRCRRRRLTGAERPYDPLLRP